MAYDKNWLFLILYEKYQKSSCTTCLIRSSDTPMDLAMNLTDFPRLLSIMVGISPTNSEILFLLKWSKWDLWADHWTHSTLFRFSVLSKDWFPNTMKSSYWSFQREHQTVLEAIFTFLYTAFLTDNVRLTLICCTVDRTRNKAHTRN